MASGILVGIGLRAPFFASALTYLALIPWVAVSLANLSPIPRSPETPPELGTRPVNQA